MADVPGSSAYGSADHAKVASGPRLCVVALLMGGETERKEWVAYRVVTSQSPLLDRSALRVRRGTASSNPAPSEKSDDLSPLKQCLSGCLIFLTHKFTRSEFVDADRLLWRPLDTPFA